MKLIADKAPFNVTLRNFCLGIAVFFLCSTVVSVIFRPSYLSHAETLVGFIFELIGNLCLLFGSLWLNPWLVLVWLIQAVFFFIGWPIAFFGVIFNYGNYRAASQFDNVILILLEYLVILAFFVFCTRLVYSFFHQLRNSTTQPQHSVVV